MELENAFINFVYSSKLKLVCFEFCIKICYIVVVYTFLILSYRILKSMCIKGPRLIVFFFFNALTFINKTFSLSIWQQSLVTNTVVL